MKRTFFDRIIIGILIVLVIAFLVFATYMTRATQDVLVAEKQENLINEAMLLKEQSIGYFIQGVTSVDYLQLRFNELTNTLKTYVWFYGKDGELIAGSYMEKYSDIPKNLYYIDDEINMAKGFSVTGSFYDFFDSTMISVGIPVYVGEDVYGYMILHTAMNELDDMQNDMVHIMYLPFVSMLLIVVLVLVYFSGTVLRPITKISRTAQEYAKGNFEAKTDVVRNDELGELAGSLEYMAGELSKLDEYRKEFIANISHDFRSPLTSIKGYLEAMLDGTIPVEKYERYLNIVLSESQRLTKLTSGLLELNDFDSCGIVLKKQYFDILEVVREVQNTFEGRCAKLGVTLCIQCRSNQVIVNADKMKIGQVIYNLVDNAIKFSPKGGTIYISVSNKSDRAFISVKDEGPGIDQEKQKKVFDRFYKTDSSRGKDKQGTGLGLAITKEIIKAHGENIDLISTEGVGSEFVFTLASKPEEGKLKMKEK